MNNNIRQGMLVKVNRIINRDKVSVTKLDIDDNGSIKALEDLELNLPATDDSIIEILKSSSYAAIFTSGSTPTTTTTIKDDENKSTIIIANAMTAEELALEQRKTVDASRSRR
ncbi:MAG: hypothetical protein ACTHKP_13205 [Nitrososphaeraceae archaeon]